MSVPGAAQGPIHLGQLEAGVRRQSNSGGEGSGSVVDLRWWFGIPVSGALVTPRVATYRFQYNPIWLRTTNRELKRGSHGQINGYSFAGDFLSSSPISFSVAAGRASSSVLETLGNSVENESKNFRAAASLNTRYMSTTLEVTRRSYFASQRGGGLDAVPILTDYELHGSRLALQSSKLQFSVSRERSESRQPGANYDGWNLNGNHVFRWGVGSSLQSQVQYLNLKGDVPRRQSQWSERLHLRHTDRVSSDHAYQQFVTGLIGLEHRGWGWQSVFTAGLGSGLDAALSLDHNVARARENRSRMTGLTSQLTLTRALPGRVDLTLSGSVGYEGRRVEGAAEFEVAVVDEAYQIGPSLSFTLRQPDVVASSVVLRSQSGGVRFVEGIDYALQSAGSFLQVLVFTGGRIQQGMVVLASYRHVERESPSVDAARGNYEISIRRGAITFSHRGALRQAFRTRIPTVGHDVNDLRNFHTEVLIQGSSRAGQVSFRASEGSQVRHTGGAPSRSQARDLSLELSPPPFGAVATTLGVGWSQNKVDSASAGVLRGIASAAWRPVRTLHLQARLEVLSIVQSGATNRYVSGSTEASWRPGRLEVDLRFDHLRRSALTTLITNYLVVQVVRRF